MEGVKRGVSASPVRVLGADVLKGRAFRRAAQNNGANPQKAAAEAVLPEFKSKTA